MIQIGGQTYNFDDPRVLATLGGAFLVLLVLWLLIATLRRAGRANDTLAPLAQGLGAMDTQVRALSEGQQRLTGGLTHVSEAQAQAQRQMLEQMETRLGQVQHHMNETLAASSHRSTRAMADLQERMNDILHGSSQKTTKSLTELQERLATIDRAQTKIEKLSGDVLSLQDILSNKQTRGAFGEIQLTDIVTKALPRDSFTLQATLSNGKRADCLIHLPNPPGPIVIDAKFPLEAYEALRAAEDPRALQEAARALKVAVRAHIKAISEKYILDGETADGALMFLPSEAIYAELHANFGDVVREGFAARVWIVSPTTCMATLNTMRAILKDARMREQAGAIRRELRLLHEDVTRLGTRVDNLDKHFGQAQKDLGEIRISAEKATRRAGRIDNFDFEDIAPESGEASTDLLTRAGQG